MFRDRRIVVCIPCGRERFLRVLIPYLLSSRAHIVDEVLLWMNTDVASDIAYITSLAERFPEKLKMVGDLGKTRRGTYNAKRNHYQYSDSICRFYAACVADDTIYIKLDDDICYVHPQFFEAICNEAIDEDDDIFAVLGNVFNVPLTSLKHQEAGMIDEAFGKCTGDARCPVACTNGEFAKHIHERFFELVDANELERLVFPSFDITGRQRIGAMAWTGETFKLFDGAVGRADERDLTTILPRRLRLPLRMCGNAILSHFSFSHQLQVLEEQSDLLERYRQLSVKETGLAL